LKVDYRLAIVGALAFCVGFNIPYNYIRCGANNAKAHAIGLFAVLWQVLFLFFRKKISLGFCFNALAMAVRNYCQSLSNDLLLYATAYLSGMVILFMQ